MVLFLALGWRISLVTAVGLPLAFCGTFLWMGLADVTINLMSMFGLIMVLGMLVDDAIVVAENIYRYLEEGYPLKDAVVEGTNEVILPVAGTILTTLAAFAPLLFMSGIMGKFIWVLPAVVSVALIFSWIESMFILPAHIYDIEKRNPNRNRESHGKGKTSPLRVRERYTSMLRTIVTHRYLAISGLVLAFFATLVFAAFQVKFILFPGGDIEILYSTAECPSGITLEEHEQENWSAGKGCQPAAGN
jgi:multidrug efflux pump subunit AcrB